MVVKLRWGHDCGNPTDPAAQAAVRRMEKNALIFSGGKVTFMLDSHVFCIRIAYSSASICVFLVF